jgi:hypothetical protein
MRVDQVEPEVAKEELLAETGQLPAGLPGLLCDLPRFPLADIPGLCRVVVHGPPFSGSGP